MSNGYQREITDFLFDYGATGIEIVPGGKHPKVEFDFRGKHVAYTIAGTTANHHASANTISDLKRLLGEPVEEEIKESRRLSDMLPAAVERQTFKGRVALYAASHPIPTTPLMFRFFLPKTLTDAIGISLGQQFSISALDKYTWHFHLIATDDGGHHPVLRKEKTNETFYIISVSSRGLTKLSPFGASPADYSIVGDAIVVHLPPETIKAIGAQGGTRPNAGRKPQQPAAQPAAIPLPPEPQPVATPEEDGAPVAERLRALLALIQGAERQTGYRLLKVRRDDKTDGVWAWRAPEIRLDE